MNVKDREEEWQYLKPIFIENGEVKHFRRNVKTGEIQETIEPASLDIVTWKHEEWRPFRRDMELIIARHNKRIRRDIQAIIIRDNRRFREDLEAIFNQTRENIRQEIHYLRANIKQEINHLREHHLKRKII